VNAIPAGQTLLSNHPAKYNLQSNNSLGVGADWKFNLI